MGSPIAAFRRFCRARSGLAAVEFALVFPIMSLFVFAGYELVRAMNVARQTTVLGNSIAQEVTASSSNTVTNADLHFFYNTAIPVFPQAMADAARNGTTWSQNIDISVSSIKFAQVCAGTCAYVPSVVWSSGAHPRSCLVPALPAADNASPSATTLPSALFGPGSLIVVDIQYKYTPLIGGGFVKPFSINRSVYVQPRYVSTIFYEKNTADDIAYPCTANIH